MTTMKKLKEIHPDVIRIMMEKDSGDTVLVFENGNKMSSFEFVANSPTRKLMEEYAND